MNQAKKIMLGVLGALMLIIILFVTPKLWEDVDAGEIVIIQDPVDGNLHVYKQAGMQWQGMGKVTHYKKSGQFWFNKAKNDKETDQSIEVKWNDGGRANISGSVRYDLPSDDAKMISIHSIFGSQEAVEQHLIKTNIEKAVYMTGPLMTSKESYAERRNDLIFYIEDQASKGVYKTYQKEDREIDPLTNVEKTVIKVKILEANGITGRQEISPITTSGIKLYNISINAIDYDSSVEKQITTQQQAMMQIQTAIAKAKEAEQRVLTVAKEGEANAAQAKWDQEVLKAKAVTQAQQSFEVAKLNRQTEAENKAALTLKGEGEGNYKKANMLANGALEQKLAAWVEVNKAYAAAMTESNWVPSVVMGGASGASHSTGGADLISLWMTKTAKDLALEMKQK